MLIHTDTLPKKPLFSLECLALLFPLFPLGFSLQLLVGLATRCNRLRITANYSTLCRDDNDLRGCEGRRLVTIFA